MTYELPIAPLTWDRCSVQRLSQVSELDFGGPLNDYRGDKCCLIVFTCGARRALHVKLVEDIIARTVIAAIEFLPRFWSVKETLLWHWKTIQKADKELERRCKMIEGQSTAVRREWEFNAEIAPLWGGFWKRTVGSVKKVASQSSGQDETPIHLTLLYSL